MSTSNIESFRDGYFFGQKIMTVEQKLDFISDMLKFLDKKNVSTESFLQELNSIKGKLFDFNVNMIVLIQNSKYLSESELKEKLKEKKEELATLNGENQKNVITEKFLKKLNTLKGKLFDLNVDLIYLVEKQDNLSDSQLKVHLEDGKNELSFINYESILLKIECCKLLYIFKS